MKTLLLLTLMISSFSSFAYTGTKFYRDSGSGENALAAIDFKKSKPVRIHFFNWGLDGNTVTNKPIVFETQEGLFDRYRIELGQTDGFLWLSGDDLSSIIRGYAFRLKRYELTENIN